MKAAITLPAALELAMLTMFRELAMHKHINWQLLNMFTEYFELRLAASYNHCASQILLSIELPGEPVKPVNYQFRPVATKS